MGLIINGNEPSKILYNGAEVSLYFNGSMIWPNTVPPILDEVTIGTQTWKSKNLSVDDGQSGIYTQTVNYGQGNVVEHYYTWDAAVRVAASINGWHLPSYDEWETLETTVGGAASAGTKLKSTYGWTSGNGTNDYGFAAFPAGNWNSGSFSDLGSGAYFWTNKEDTSTKAYGRRSLTGTWVGSIITFKTRGYSVRLIKD